MADLKVLIVEDDEVAAEILHKFVTLARPAAQVEWVWNGHEALVRIRSARPDVILLDYMMPKVDGKDFLAVLNELGVGSVTRIAVVSAYVDKDNEKMFFAMGAHDVLPKPVSIEQIEAVLESAERGRDAGGTGAPPSA